MIRWLHISDLHFNNDDMSTDSMREELPKYLKKNNIRYDAILYNAPYGERILINDAKPSGLCTSVAINTRRDCWCDKIFREVDEL